MDADRRATKFAGLLRPSPDLIVFLMGWEGPPHFVPREDPCAPGVWDIGYGHVCNRSHPPITAQEAVNMLRADVASVAAGVNRLTTVELAQHQFDALVSFAFNVGLDEDEDKIAEGLGDSTLLKRVEYGAFADAAKQFALWNKAGGRVRTGLVKRRAAEARMFVHADYTGRP